MLSLLILIIYKSFQKLIDRGHIIPLSKLTLAQREAIDMAPTSYTIPWDVGFKETSVSAPAHPTFDASSKTSSGYSLNDCLAKGNASLIDLVSMVQNWMICSHAVAGDSVLQHCGAGGGPLEIPEGCVVQGHGPPV